MLSVDDVWALIDREIRALPCQQTPLADAPGRRLAEDILADADMPAFSRSAIDGFALAAGSPPGRYRVIGETRPGMAPPSLPGDGQAVKIFTGTALPESEIELVMLEDTATEGDNVVTRVESSAKYVRVRASQAGKGDVLLPMGGVITPGTVALLAAVGNATPLASPRPRVAHLSTGSELVAVDAAPEHGCIRDSNTPLIAAMLCEAGAERIFHGQVSESVDHAVAALENVPADLLLISGGASVGAHDGTAEVLKRLGFTIHCSKANVRPGKPLIFGTRGNTAAFGLPGNPLSHFVCFHLFVRRVLDLMAGLPARRLTQVFADHAPRTNPRETWWPAQVRAEEGTLRAQPLPWIDSSDLTSLPNANALLRVQAKQPATLAEALLFDGLKT